MSNLEVVLLSIAIVLFTTIAIESKVIEYLWIQNASLHTQIESLKVQSEQQANRVKLAQEEADMEMMKVHATSHSILNTVVPVDCNAAVRWAINEAHNFN